MTDDNQVDNTEVRAEAQDQEMESRAFTQEQLDKIVADRLARQRSQLEKRYEGVDVDRYRELISEEENRRIEAMKKREEFDSVLKETVEKKDSHIQQLREEIHSVKVEGAVLNASSAAKAVSPQQVNQLLKNSVKLGETGNVEVLDSKGNVRYSESGDPMTITELVQEFLSENPHFVQPNSGGSGVSSVVGSKDRNGTNIDLANLDLTKPEHRAIYKQQFKS